MCLAVPARVIAIDDSLAELDMEGNRLEADISMVPGLAPGDWVLVHAGYVIEKYDEQEAQKTLQLLRDVAAAGMEKEELL